MRTAIILLLLSTATARAGNHELSFEALKAGRNGKFVLPIDYVRLRKR